MSDKWAEIGERGTWGAYAGTLTLAVVYRLLGRTLCRMAVTPVATYFYLAGAKQRQASLDYLGRAWKAGLLPRRPGFWDGLRHFVIFSYASVDKLAAWTGRIRREDVDGASGDLVKAAKASGALIVTAHLGNPEVVRAIAAMSGAFRVTVLVHTVHAAGFNRAMQQMSPGSPVRLMQVTDIDLGMAMRLSEAVNRGEWVVMAADRVAVKDGEGSAVTVDFLGAPALFPTGPFVLASALKCPTYTLFCFQHRGRYRVEIDLLDNPVSLPRGRRAEALKGYVEKYARRLEQALAKAPFQWFNFYDYWLAPAGGDAGAKPESEMRLEA